MYAYGTDKHLFAWLECQGYATEFNQLMVGYHLGRKSWGSPGGFPVQERLIDGAIVGDEVPFLVDIGGNVGHDLLQFKLHYPDAPGRLILQDLDTVIGQITDLDPSIIRMGHDFHNEQPVKGMLPLRIIATKVAEAHAVRRPRILHALYPARLARQGLRDDIVAYQGGHEARVQ